MKITDFSFRKEQVSALDNIRVYLKEFDKKNTDKSMLVCMPTGSGKSGVIAFTVRNYSKEKKKSVLVLAPRAKITEQLYTEVSGKFFKKLDKSLPLEKLFGDCKYIKNDLDELETNVNQKIYFLNIQKLMKLWSPPKNSSQKEKARRIKIWNSLVKNVGLILVDEGHYEPAHSWSECIRSFNQAAKIIFTATPYRNDLRDFNIDLKFKYVCSYDESLKNGNLRSIEFLNPCQRANYRDFTESLIKERDRLVKEKKILEDSKVIIRCDNFDSIQKIAEILEEKGHSYYAIHERFPGLDGKKRRKVPQEIVADKTIYWIHQYKLMEGVDDPAFRVLGNFDHFSNSRSLVQQIGRIIRKAGKGLEFGYVLENSGGKENVIWETYKKYDLYIKDHPDQINFDSKDFIIQLSKIHPNFAYIDGNFRRQFSFDDFRPEEDLTLPLTCNLFELKSNIDLKLLKQEIVGELLVQDKVAQGYMVDEDVLVILHSSVENPKFLLNHCYLENKVDFILVFSTGKHVAVIDNSGYVEYFLNSKLIKISQNQLQRLYKHSKETIISSISLTNANVGPNSIRKKSFSARKVSETSIFVDDFSQICTTSSGYSFELNPFTDSDKNEHVKRYIGYNSGKISQDLRFEYTLIEYKHWVELLISRINSTSQAHKLFQRYSSEVKPEKPANISNILLYMYDLDTYFRYNKSSLPIFQDLCVDVNDDGTFKIEISGTKYDCSIEQNPSLASFKIISSALDKDFIPLTSDFKSVVSYLNKGQQFSLLFKGKNYVYSTGKFYQPEIRVGENFDDSEFNVLSFLETAECLESIVSEKGKTTKGSTWESGSLFRLIADCGKNTTLENYLKNPSYLVCDDMGTEVADFIMLKDKKVVFIHCKAADGNADVSASSLQEVCGQATKNVSYLSPFNKISPAGITSKWNTEWSANGVKGTVKNRFIKGKKNPKEFWAAVTRQLQDPNVAKEVWIVLGNSLKKHEFESQLKSKTGNRVALQAALLLQSTYQTTYSIGARLRVFCSP